MVLMPYDSRRTSPVPHDGVIYIFWSIRDYLAQFWEFQGHLPVFGQLAETS